MPIRKIGTVCLYCGAEAVEAHEFEDHVSIQCGACQRRIYTFYPDQREDSGLYPSLESALLEQVTEPARNLYELLKRYIEKNGYAPTLRESTRLMGWHSPSTTHHHLDTLETAGLIERDYATSRGIRLPHG